MICGESLNLSLLRAKLQVLFNFVLTDLIFPLNARAGFWVSSDIRVRDVSMEQPKHIERNYRFIYIPGGQ